MIAGEEEEEVGLERREELEVALAKLLRDVGSRRTRVGAEVIEGVRQSNVSGNERRKMLVEAVVEETAEGEEWEA